MNVNGERTRLTKKKSCPFAPCMEYLLTFGLKLWKNMENGYMDPMGS